MRLALALPASRPRSFRQDALACTDNLRPFFKVFNAENIPGCGPCLITVNHYSKPGFQAWWLALSVNRIIPQEIHWVMTAAWTFPGRGAWSHSLVWLSKQIFRKVAVVYGFSTMPPMPPDPLEVNGRANAVRQVLKVARSKPDVWIGIAPEGRDAPGGVLQMPPPGTGRFLFLLAQAGLSFLPVGFYEDESGICLSFGKPYCLPVESSLTPAERDWRTSQTVMRQIAALLPSDLQGEFARESC